MINAFYKVVSYCALHLTTVASLLFVVEQVNRQTCSEATASMYHFGHTYHRVVVKHSHCLCAWY